MIHSRKYMTHLAGLGFLTVVLTLGPAARAFDPVPTTLDSIENPSTPDKIELGRRLYFDPRLSKTSKVSCNSCHDVRSSGTDNQPTSTGIHNQKGGRNSPTVWNAAFYSAQFWDGRAASLEEQARGPLVNPVEMGMENHNAVMKNVAAIPGYKPLFVRAFGKEAAGKEVMTIENLSKAIAAYERTLLTPNSPFDRFLRGESGALSASAMRGFELVQKIGCTGCHNGAHFAGPPMPPGQGFFMKFPTIEGTEYEKKYHLGDDLGRYQVTKKDADKHLWRVPSWRNVELTAPYFHNGSVATLDEAVRVMAKTQLAKDLKADEVNDIVAFLKSLTGKRPKQTVPSLP